MGNLLADEEARVSLSPVLPAFAIHMTQTLIRNYAAYKFVFTEQRNEVTQLANLDVNTPLPTRPLSAFKKVDGDADSVVEGANDEVGIDAGDDEPVE